MNRTKRILSLILSFALVFSTLGLMEINAATDDTRYSVKHIKNGGFEENVEKYLYYFCGIFTNYNIYKLKL